MSATLVLSSLLSAVFLAVLGVLIRYFGTVELVAGYDPETVTDEDALAAFVGANTLSVAALTGAVAAVEYTRPFDGYRAVWLPYALAVVLLAVRTVRGARRYEAPRE
jgi:hypothetical protein